MARVEPVEIIEDGLLLRPWRAADADAVHRACQDPDIQRWTTVPRPYLPEHALGFVTEISATAWAEGTGAPFAVCDAGTGELLGSCGLVSHRPRPGLRRGRLLDRPLGARPGRGGPGHPGGRPLGVRRARAAPAHLAGRGRQPRLPAGRAAGRLPGRGRAAAGPPASAGRRGRLDRLAAARRGARARASPARPARAPSPPAGPPSSAARSPSCFATAGAAELRLRPLEEQRPGRGRGRPARTRRPSAGPPCRDPYQRADAEGFLRDVASAAWARGHAAPSSPSPTPTTGTRARSTCGSRPDRPARRPTSAS